MKYTFVDFAIILIRQILGPDPLPLTSPFQVEALSFRLGSSFGLLHGSSNLFAVLFEVPLLPFAPFLDFYLHRFQHREELGNYFRHPLHIIVHHEVLVR